MHSTVVPLVDERKLAEHYLRFILSDTILSCTYGIDAAVDRVLRVSQRAWSEIPQDSRPPFYTFITDYFPETSRLPTYRKDELPWVTIPRYLPSCGLDAPTYGGSNVDDSACYHVVDVVASDRSRFVPSTLFIPYKTRSSQRCRQVLERINPIPLWFFGEDGVIGVPIQGADDVRLLHGQDELRLNSNDKPITTLKVKFGWPNYESAEKQIRASSNAPLNNLDRLARLTAGAVRSFMSDEPAEVTINKREPQAWRIGTGPGEVKITDVLLLGVIFVSDGAVMPLLAVY